MDNFVDLFMVSPLLLAVLFFVAMLAGFIDALAGGGGLLTVPALLAAGIILMIVAIVIRVRFGSLNWASQVDCWSRVLLPQL